jgi:hypothetical protein
MELVRWPRAAILTTCEQDRCVCVCVILYISSWRYGRIVTLFRCINDDCNLSMCVILHIASWRYGRILTLFWCINDDSTLCVFDFACQETCFCNYLCAVQFFHNKGDMGLLILVSCMWLRWRRLANARLFYINAHYWTEAEYKHNIYSILGKIYYKQNSNSTTSHILQKWLKFHQDITSFILPNGFHFHQYTHPPTLQKGFNRNQACFFFLDFCI